MKSEVRISCCPSGVCSTQIDVTLSGDTVESVCFTGGCSGNSQGVAALVRGMNVFKVIGCLEGINCGDRRTSCPDQLARILKKALAGNG